MPAIERDRRVIQFVADATPECLVEEAEAGSDVGRRKVSWVGYVCREELVLGRCRGHEECALVQMCEGALQATTAAARAQSDRRSHGASGVT